MTLGPTSESPDTVRSLLRESLAWSVNRFMLYLLSARFWMVVIPGTVVAAIAGPFDTLNMMSFGLRLMFWVSVLVPSILLQFYVSILLREFARRTDLPWGLAAFVAGCIGAVAIFGWVLLMQALMVAPDKRFPLPMMVVWTIFIVPSLTMVINAFMPTLQPLWGTRRGAAVKHQPSIMPTAEPSPLFDRLPSYLGRDVICIRADNHHIEVTTTRGHARILMRLADAQADLATLPGMRVHRSHWVNLTMVSHTQSRQGAMDLVLSTGVRVPVSRALRATVSAQLAQVAAE